MQLKSYSKSTYLAVVGICTALVALATFLIKIPGAMGGYVNMGDAFIFFSAALFGPLCGLVCGSVGSAAADVLGGYMVYAPFTLVIKGLEGLICGLLVRSAFKKTGTKPLHTALCALSAIISGLVMVVGYYFTAAILFGSMYSALFTIPENLIQAGVSVAVFLMLISVFLLKKER